MVIFQIYFDSCCDTRAYSTSRTVDTKFVHIESTFRRIKKSITFGKRPRVIATKPMSAVRNKKYCLLTAYLETDSLSRKINSYCFVRGRSVNYDYLSRRCRRWSPCVWSTSRAVNFAAGHRSIWLTAVTPM